MKNFIITSLQSWDIEIGSTIHNTALEISKTNRVLYINTPVDIASRIRKTKDKTVLHRIDVIKKRKPCLRQINENLWVADCPFTAFSINQLPTAWLFDFFNYLNNYRIGKYIVKVAKELNFTNFIHLIDTDIYRSQYLKEIIKPALSVYYCRDFVIGESYWKKNGARLEPKIAAKSDVVLANSTKFAERFRQYNTNTYPIETGVDIELYDPTKSWETPNDISSIAHPIIGYMGTVNSTRLDSELLYSLALKNKNYSFVFTGPEDDVFSQHKIHSLPNVYFLGKKPISSLPGYIVAYDVCINPQMVNDITNGNYPLKIDEYLAMGKPIVATSTHLMNDIFADYVHLATGEEEYQSAIEKALAEVGDEALIQKRIAFGQSHSWGHSVNKIYGIIDKNLK